MITGRSLCSLATSLLLVISASAPHGSAAPGKKRKSSAAHAARKQARSKAKASSRRLAQRAEASRRGKKAQRLRTAESEEARLLELIEAARRSASVPDQIEVIEYSSAKLSDAVSSARQPSRAALPGEPPASNFHISTRRLEVAIEPQRVTEIQQALAQQGFYPGAPSGVYDEATVEAMRRFQASQRIAVTGYPTAHALKRLGLTNW
jgi:hypothetical protein